jgi:hypothetical protein
MRIQSLAEVAVLRSQVMSTCDQTIGRIAALCAETQPGFHKMRKLRFEDVGVDPLEATPLNFVEQLNQAFTWLTAFKAIETLHRMHPNLFPCEVNAGNVADGFDIESAQGGVVAEVFAAVKPTNNRKLEKDVAKIKGVPFGHKYVFFNCPDYVEGRCRDLETAEDVQVWAVEL